MKDGAMHVPSKMNRKEGHVKSQVVVIPPLAHLVHHTSYITYIHPRQFAHFHTPYQGPVNLRSILLLRLR